MKYIVDIINTTTDEEFNSWVSAGNHTVIHLFNHFEKTYLIETNSEIVVGDIVESVVIDDHTTALKLLLAPTFTIDTTNDDNWWKSIVVADALETATPEVFRQGEGYAVYLMDSGVNDSHPDFSTSTIRHLFSHTGTNADLNGHGTALASLISGTVAGITSAEVISVKVFENGVVTLISDLLRALDAVAVDYIQHYSAKPAVVNMSWGINKNEYVETKIRAMIDLGLLFVAAAGNSGIPIGDVTPAGMPEVVTVGSINTNLEPSDFSNYTGTSAISLTANETNYAPGLDYWAPGEHILAANKDGGFNHIAGTSASAAIFSASAIYNFARSTFGFDNTIRVSNLLSDALDGNELLTIDRTSFRNQVLLPIQTNYVLTGRNLVALTEKYKMCTKRVPYVRGVKIINLEAEVYLASMGRLMPLVRPGAYIKKDIPNRFGIFYHPDQIESFSFSGLPDGLTVEGNNLVGTMTEDLAGELFKEYNTTLTLVRGAESVVIPFRIVYVDTARLSESFTSTDYANQMQEAGLKLMEEPCTNCAGNPFGCSAFCTACGICSEDKLAPIEYVCTPSGNCP